MKSINFKKTGVLVLICTILFLFAGCSINFGGSKETSIGSMNAKVGSITTDTYKTPFSLEKGQTVTFKYSSEITNGNLTMKLVDSAGALISDFETNRKESKEVKIDKNDTYYIVVICDKFTGKYEIKWENHDNKS